RQVLRRGRPRGQPPDPLPPADAARRRPRAAGGLRGLRPRAGPDRAAGRLLLAGEPPGRLQRHRRGDAARAGGADRRSGRLGAHRRGRGRAGRDLPAGGEGGALLSGPSLVLVSGPESILADRAVESVIADARGTSPDLAVVTLAAEGSAE